MTKKKISQKSYSDNPYIFQFKISSRKQLRILQEIWLKYLSFKCHIPNEKTQLALGDLYKLTHLLHDPISLVLLPYLHPRNTFQTPMNGLKISIMKFPKMGNFRVAHFFKEFSTLIQQATEKNKTITDNLIDLFVENIWNSTLFKSNRDQDAVIASFEKYFKNHNYEEKLASLHSEDQLNALISSQEHSVTDINDLILDQINSFSPDPHKKPQSFREIHKDVKQMFEFYGYLIGFIRGLFDIFSDTVDPKIENYMNRKFNVCYGLPRNKARKSEKRASVFTMKLRKSTTNPTLRYLIDKMVFGKLRPLQNSASPPVHSSNSENGMEQIYVVENKRQDYIQQFTLREFWVLRSNLVIFLNLCFNYFFYSYPFDQVKARIDRLLMG